MAHVIRHIVNERNAVELDERLSNQGPFDTREQAEQRLNELEREKANGKFTIEELVLSCLAPTRLLDALDKADARDPNHLGDELKNATHEYTRAFRGLDSKWPPCPVNEGPKWSRGIAEGWIYREAPNLEQPFWDVDTVPVLSAPGPKFRRRGIHLRRKVQLPDVQFEFSSERRGGRDGMSPIGISAFASHSWETACIMTRTDHTLSLLPTSQKSPRLLGSNVPTPSKMAFERAVIAPHDRNILCDPYRDFRMSFDGAH